MAYDPYAMTQYPQGYYNQQPGLGRGFGRSPYGMPQGTGAAVPLPAAAPTLNPNDFQSMWRQYMQSIPVGRRMSKTFQEDFPYMYGNVQNFLMSPAFNRMQPQSNDMDHHNRNALLAPR